MATSRMPSSGVSLPRLAAALLLLAGAVVAVVMARPRSDSPSADRPDIVLVVWDTCRADRLSTFGYPRPTTPLLEELAEEGVRFSRCVAPAPITAPSHGSLFTGLYPWRHGLLTGREDRLRENVPTLAERLRRSGYETVCLSGNAFISPVTGLARGFETFIPYWKGDTGNKEGSFALAAVETWLADRAAAPEGTRRPLFLFINMMDTHLPLRPEDGDVEAVRPPGVGDRALLRARELDAPHAMAHLLGVNVWDEEVLAGLGARYDGAAHAVDRWTGRIFGSLRGAGLLEESLQVIVGDHGEALGEHGMLDHRMNLLEQVLHVPLVIRWPGRFDDGSTATHAVSVLDLHTTLLEAAGLEAPAGTDAVALSTEAVPGRRVFAHSAAAPSYVPDIRVAFPGVPDEALLPFHTDIDAVVADEGGACFKYLRYVLLDETGRPAGEREELYDIARDPEEAVNLLSTGAEGAAARAAELREALRAVGR